MKEAFHKGFRLEGQSFDYEDLNEVAYSLVKEGEPHEKSLGDFLMDWLSGAPEIVQYTSGSTGPPGRIHLSKSAMVRAAEQTGSFLDMRPGARVLSCLPFTTIAGRMMLVRALVNGWNLVPVPPSARPLDSAEGEFDFTAMVPLQLKASLDGLERIARVIVGGAPVPASLLSELPASGTVIWESFGMTETASHVALRELRRLPDGADPEKELPPFCGLEGITFRTDKRGCLVIDAPDRFDEPLKTNDLVELESDRCFRWQGRWDHVINSGGVKIIAEQLEAQLTALLSNRYFVAGEPDDRLGERLVLYVEGTVDTSELLERIRASGRFTKYEVPKEIYNISSFAETPSGKVDRSATSARDT